MTPTTPMTFTIIISAIKIISVVMLFVQASIQLFRIFGLLK